MPEKIITKGYAGRDGCPAFCAIVRDIKIRAVPDKAVGGGNKIHRTAIRDQRRRERPIGSAVNENNKQPSARRIDW